MRDMVVSGHGESQRRILGHLKRRGPGAIPAIAADLGLNVETVRAHLRALGSEGLVRRSGRRSGGRGRPEVIYELTAAAQPLFPSREGELLRDLAVYLEENGELDVLKRFFADRLSRRRGEAMKRVESLSGPARVEEVARILSEEGFMAEVETDASGRLTLRLCHCPIRELVAVTNLPCRAELGFVRELLGERPARVSYIPSGAAACCYAVEGR